MRTAPAKLGHRRFSSHATDAARNNKIDKISKYAQNYAVAPICAFSAITGALSYFLPNHFNTENETVGKAAFYSGKAAILLNAGFGGYENFCTKNTIGFLGYISDFVTSFIANEENMYTLRGIGSALDQLPGFLEVLADQKHPEIMKRYNPRNNPNYKFAKYKSFGDSFEKTVTSAKIVFSDLAKDFHKAYSKKGILPALLTPFQKAEKNLLISSIGILLGVGTYLIPGGEKIGPKIRDVFGLQADLALGHKAVTGEKRKSYFAYIFSCIFYTIGTLLDFGYRWTEKQNLNLFAIGTDRFGAFLLAMGNAMDNRDARNGRNSDILRFNRQAGTGRKPQTNRRWKKAS